PGVGSAQGAVFVFSDLLSDHQLYLLVSSFSGAGFGNLLDNFSGTAFYLNQAHRVNWGVGAFRLRGLCYEGDFSTLYDETSGGVFGEIRYPLSRFTRIEAEYRIEHSNRFDITRPDLLENGSTEFHRVGWLASNYVSYVRDNTLWLPTGPIDGVRMNLTGFPFGVARFPGVQGALFCDLGSATTATALDRGTLGSTGLGLRMSLGAPLVLRLDLGYRFHAGDISGYALPSGSRGSRFVDFF